jgi:hypothetical protein
VAHKLSKVDLLFSFERSSAQRRSITLVETTCDLLDAFGKVILHPPCGKDFRIVVVFIGIHHFHRTILEGMIFDFISLARSKGRPCDCAATPRKLRNMCQYAFRIPLSGSLNNSAAKEQIDIQKQFCEELAGDPKINPGSDLQTKLYLPHDCRQQPLFTSPPPQVKRNRSLAANFPSFHQLLPNENFLYKICHPTSLHSFARLNRERAHRWTAQNRNAM